MKAKGAQSFKEGIRRMAEDNGGLLKAAISGLVGAAFGIMITYSTGMASNRTEIVRLATKVDNLAATIENNLNDNYRNSDALRDLTPIREKIAEITNHDRQMEAEMKAHFMRDEEIFRKL